MNTIRVTVFPHAEMSVEMLQAVGVFLFYFLLFYYLNIFCFNFNISNTVIFIFI
jgi:hypothetical protein